MTAFPNLQHLEIDYSMQARRDSIRDLDRIRQENLEWKERPHQWQSLQFVSVDKWCFNALALRGKVPSLDVNSYLSFPPAEQTSRLRAAFSRLKIERLTLRVQSELTQLPLLFSTSLDTLAQLHLDVLFRPEATETCRQQLVRLQSSRCVMSSSNLNFPLRTGCRFRCPHAPQASSGSLPGPRPSIRCAPPCTRQEIPETAGYANSSRPCVHGLARYNQRRAARKGR